MARIVNVHLDRSKLPENHVEINKAVGYLSMWALPETEEPSGFDSVDIYNDGNNDMVANYHSSTTPGRGYTIGAIWRSEGEKNQYGADLGEYSFHS